MRIDLSSVFNFNNKAKTEDVKRKKVATNHQSSDKKMTKGQTVKGQVTNISKSAITLQLSNGQEITGRMTESFEFLIGEEVSFTVEESENDVLLLKPLIDGDLSESRLMDILKNAGLKTTTENLDMLKQLISKGMPINKQILTELSMYTKRFPEAKIEQIIFLTKNDIMVSSDSLKYVDELLANKNNMTENISSFNDDVSRIVEKESGARVINAILKENEPATNVFTKIRNFFLKPEDQVIVAKEKLDLPLTELMTNKAAKSLLDETSIITRPTNSGSTISSMQQFVNEKGQAFSQLFEMVEDMDMPFDIKEATNKLLAQRVTYSMLNNELMLNQKDIQDVDSINKHYNKVYDRIMDVVNLDLNDTSESVQKILKEAVDIKNNVEFMNQLQQNHQFVHIPVMLNEQQVNSELYIMHRKNTKGSSEERITALLRLDLRNLGHLDIYVAKTANNVEVNFYVENETIEEDIRNNSMQLHKKLIEESFNVLGISVLLKEEEFNIIDDFFEKKEGSNDSKRFTFDMRA